MKLKQDNWSKWLLEASITDLWTANKFIRDPVGDGGRPRIPTLKVMNKYDKEIEITSNDEKAKIFAKSFFPPVPDSTHIPDNYEHPELLPDPASITREQVKWNIL